MRHTGRMTVAALALLNSSPPPTPAKPSFGQQRSRLNSCCCSSSARVKCVHRKEGGPGWVCGGGWGGWRGVVVQPWASSSSATSIDNKVCFSPSGRRCWFFLLCSATAASTWQAIWAVCCNPPLISPGLDYWIFRVHCFAAAAADETSEVLFDQYQLEHKTAKLIFPPSVATLLQCLQHNGEGPSTVRIVDQAWGTLCVQKFFTDILYNGATNSACPLRCGWRNLALQLNRSSHSSVPPSSNRLNLLWIMQSIRFHYE